MKIILLQLVFALLLTLIVECFVILPLFSRHCNNRNKLVYNFILINAITNLSLNSLILAGMDKIILAELIIPLIEAALFIYVGVKRSKLSIILICYVANLLSFGLGSVLSYFYQTT